METTAPHETPKESKDFNETLVKGLGTFPDSDRKSLVQKQEKEASENDVVFGSNANEIP